MLVLAGKAASSHATFAAKAAALLDMFSCVSFTQVSWHQLPAACLTVIQGWQPTYLPRICSSLQVVRGWCSQVVCWCRPLFSATASWMRSGWLST